MSEPNPRKEPNAENRVKVLGSALYLDSPTQTHGVVVRANQDEGWLRIEVEADDSVIGWALSFNGRDVPINTVDPAELTRLRRVEEAARAIDAWASRMPDAGFNDQDPRWDWWHERPRLESFVAPDLCHICKQPLDQPGELFCSAGHPVAQVPESEAS